MQKTVRCYDVRYIGPNTGDAGVPMDPGFWTKLGDQVEQLEAENLQLAVRGRQLYGESRRAKQPLRRYLYVGKVRDRAEWPDTLNSSTGTVARLEPTDRGAVLLEPTYLLPYGQMNRVAVMGMSVASPRVASIEDWLTAIAGLNTASEHISLLPILNPNVFQRLSQAEGATIFRVLVDPVQEIPQGGSQVGRAAREAKAVSNETTVELRWSLGHSVGSEDTKDNLLNAARWASSGWAKSANVTLELPDGDGETTKVPYDLVRERLTYLATFEVPEGQFAEEVSVLSGMTEAIEYFNREMS